MEDVEREHLKYSQAKRLNPNYMYYLPIPQSRNQRFERDVSMRNSRDSSLNAGDADSSNEAYSMPGISANSLSALHSGKHSAQGLQYFAAPGNAHVRGQPMVNL